MECAEMQSLSAGHVSEDQHDRVWAIIFKARQNKYSNRVMLALSASFIFLLEPSTPPLPETHTHTHTHTHTRLNNISMLSNSCWPYFHMIKHDPLYQMQCYQRLKDWKTLMRDHPPTQRLQISPLYVPHRYHTTWVLWISPFLAALFALAC